MVGTPVVSSLYQSPNLQQFPSPQHTLAHAHTDTHKDTNKHTQPEPEPDLKGPKGKQTAASKQRGGTAQRKREAKGSRPGTETPEGGEDVVPQEVEDTIAAELLALGV